MEKRYSLGTCLAGAGAARAGDDMSGPALMLAAFALTGSATEASALLAGITLAAAVGGPVLGALLDRAARPGRLLAGALALYALGLTVILLGLGRLPFTVTVLIAVVTGLLGPALSGGWTAQLPRVVRRERLPRANALDAMTFSTASLAGPALAGAAAELLGAPAAVVASVVLIGLALPAAWRLPVRPEPAVARGPTPVRSRRARVRGHSPVRGHGGSVAGDLAAGARCIVRRPRLARATLTSVVSCTGQGMLVACTPLLGERALGGAGHGAMLLSCVAVSALTANAVLARFPAAFTADTVLWTSTLVQAAALAALAVQAAGGLPAVLVAAALLAGLGEGPQLTALFTVRHAEAPERLRGQIFTTGASLKISGFALGAAAAGPLATWSLPGALAAAAGVQLLAATAYFAVPATGGPARRAWTRPRSARASRDAAEARTGRSGRRRR
ncbi:MFS transporter [Streptomyces armeniacus]|uniref:MFS transporter n=1 Tax=Streptomyces armeniacus TaxID=83291 RepID=A0A345XTQ7_9ACTN|nr:MFS transporter [Streptomyces armeniacus]AXK35023.1 MFS transporter [Streptomyces armeniacus]